ncbi:MAG: glycosyltransferase family 39 protein [Candidatus Omnitrophica bacterium]|jgi:hypothetical protein|nr:glycosyltransferase family 39 protein [Candidatus Omnitrophota bacterium]
MQNRDKASSSRVIYYGLFIFAVSFWVRWLLLSKGPFHYDTVDFLIQMREHSISEHGIYMPLASVFVIFLSWIKSLFLKNLDDLNLLMFVTVLFSSLGQMLGYLLFRKRIGDASSFALFLLFSFYPAFLSVTTFGRIDHALASLLLPICLFYLFELSWIKSSIFAGLAIASRGECALVIPAMLFWLIIQKRENILYALRCVFLFSLFSLGLWALISLLAARKGWVDNFIMPEIVQRFFIKKPDQFLIVWEFTFAHIAQGFVMLGQTLRVSILACLVGLYLWMKKENLKLNLFFFIAFLVPFVYVVNREADTPRYLIVPVFFLFYYAARGIAYLSRERLFLSGALTFLFIIPMFLYIYPLLWQRHLHAYQVDFAKNIEAFTQPNSLIITQDEWIFLKYYTKREALVPPSDCDVNKWTDFLSQLRKHYQSGRPLYLVSSGLSYDPCRVLFNFIQNNFFLQRQFVLLNENWHQDCAIRKHLLKEELMRLVPR